MASSIVKPDTPKAEQIAVLEAFEKAVDTCSVPWVFNYSTRLPGAGVHFTELMTILAGVACIINTLISLYLIWGHCFHWVKPHEQRQIVRIIIWIPFTSISCLFGIWFYNASGFIEPVANFYEGFAITALFLLYVQLVTPDGETRDTFFAHLQRQWVTGAKKHDKGSLRWFRVIWALVFQVTIIRIATLIATEVLWTYTCPLDKWRQYGFIIITVVSGVSTGFAVTACIIFEKRLRPLLDEHKGLFKLVSFKLVVGLSATQSVLFSGLASAEVFYPKPPFRVSFNDFRLGLSQFVLVWEMTIVALFFLKSFEFEPYLRQTRSGVPVQASAGKALLSTLNTSDIYQATAYAIIGHRNSSRGLDENDNLEKNEAVAHQAESLLGDSNTKYQGASHNIAE